MRSLVRSMDLKRAASGRPYEHAPLVQAKAVQVLCHFQGSFSLPDKAPCSDFLSAHCAEKVSAFSMTVSNFARPLPMESVNDDSNDDAKEASLDEEGKAPQVKRLHVEGHKRAVESLCHSCRHQQQSGRKHLSTCHSPEQDCLSSKR